MRKYRVLDIFLLAALFLLLSAAVLVGLAAATDNPFPGETPDSSPLAGDLNSTSDRDDYYRFSLLDNQQLRVTSLAPIGFEIDLGLWDALVSPSSDLKHGLVWDTQVGRASELIYDAVDAKPTDVALQVHQMKGSGTYELGWSILHAPDLSTECTPPTIAYGTSADITGSMTDLYASSPATGQPVRLWYSYDNKFWKLSSRSTVTAEDGSFVIPVAPKTKTWYRITAGGTSDVGVAITDSFWVKPQVYLSKPYAPSSVRRGAYFTSTGYIKPRHTAGGKVVKLYCERLEGGNWVRKATFYPVNRNYSSYTKYSGRVVLKQSGSWRIRAYHSSEQHATTFSSYRYLKVR